MEYEINQTEYESAVVGEVFEPKPTASSNFNIPTTSTPPGLEVLDKYEKDGKYFVKLGIKFRTLE